MNLVALVIALVSTAGAGALTISAVAAEPTPVPAVEPGGLHAGHEPGEPFWSWERD